MTKKLIASGCAVGWNPDTQAWDLKLRRGALGEAQVQVVIEHHGGPRRLLRLAATIRPSQSVTWAQGLLGVAAVALVLFEPGAALAIVAVFLAGLWIAPIAEATRLEAAIQSAAEEIIVDLGATSADETAPAPSLS
jgi:hypothetical protein